MTALRSRRAALAFALGLSLAGCGDDKHGAAVDAGPAGAPSGPVVGGKFGQALASAAAAQPSSKAAAATDGPPENGVFAPGAADKAHPAGAPATVELLGEGDGPKTALTFAPGALAEAKTTVTVAFKFGQQALPSVDYALAAKIDKPKDDGKSGAGAAQPGGAQGTPDPAAPARVIVKIAGATLSREQPGSLPREMADSIAKLKGGELRYRLSSQGVMSDLSYTLSKDAEPAQEAMMRSLADALSLLAAPVPAKPVGVGAYWMVTDRATSMIGLEGVRYRVYRLTKLQKDRASLTVDVRLYSAKEDLEGGMMKGRAHIERFESQGKTAIDWTPQLFAAGAEGVQRMGAAMSGGQGNQRPVLQTDLKVRLGTGHPADAAGGDPARGP